MDAAGAATNASIMNNLICPLVAFIHTLLGNHLICISCIEVPEIRNKKTTRLKQIVYHYSIYNFRHELLIHHCCHGYDQVSIRCEG